MAIIKKPVVKKERMVKKTITLSADVWRDLNAYARYAGITGRAADKANYIVGEALEHVFESDKGFAEAVRKEEEEKAKEPVKGKPATPKK